MRAFSDFLHIIAAIIHRPARCYNRQCTACDKCLCYVKCHTQLYRHVNAVLAYGKSTSSANKMNNVYKYIHMYALQGLQLRYDHTTRKGTVVPLLVATLTEAALSNLAKKS